MMAFHLWFVPLVGLVSWRLARRKQHRDAIAFLAVSLAGYALWVTVISRRPFIITVFIEQIIVAIRAMIGLG